MIDEDIRKMMLQIGKNLISNLEEDLSDDECQEDENDCTCSFCSDNVDDLYTYSSVEDYYTPSKKSKYYDSLDFIDLIMDYGGSKYQNTFLPNLKEELTKVSSYLEKRFSVPYFSVKAKDYCIVIAAPIYIRKAPIKIGKELGIIPESFVEVSGPSSTVLIIDCEKQWLRMNFLDIGGDEWLL